MKKSNFTNIAAFVAILVVLVSTLSIAQTTINLPQACNCPSGGGGQASTNGTAVVSGFGNSTCASGSSGTITGTITEGTPVSGVSLTIYANVTTLGTYNLSSTQNGVTFAGSGTFTTLGCQPVVLTASGTPTGSGPVTWCTNTTPQGCSSATIAAATPQFPAGSVFCNGTPTAIVEVTSPTGRIWMDRNLGASQVATSATDAAAYGDLYQWGRLSDGHQCRTSLTTPTQSTTDVPGNDNFISTPSSPFPQDWRNPSNDNLWQGVNGINNPCPTGFRLPTILEWDAEVNNFPASGSTGAFNSVLKLQQAGNRQQFNGNLSGVGSQGFYWSSTPTASSTAGHLVITASSSQAITGNRRQYGQTVRCIKN